MKGWIGFLVCSLWGSLLLSQELSSTLVDAPFTSAGVPTWSSRSWNNDSLYQAELLRRATNPGSAPRFAQVNEVDIDPQSYGRWTVDDHGIRTWRLRIESKGAYSLNLGFTEFHLPPSAQLLIHGQNPKTTYGPFTPADNEVHNALWTPIIPGEVLQLELQLSEKEIDDLQFRLRFINHDFMGFGRIAVGDCHIDVACDQDTDWPQVDQFRAAIHSVGVLSIDGERTCTGYLVNNSQQDCTPYFITAAHCDIDRSQARSMVVYWNFQNSYCRAVNSFENSQNGNGELNTFNTGAFLLASSEASDFILFRLDDPIPEEANAYFAGWDNRPEVEQGLYASIHHPLTQEKRISFTEAPIYPGKWGEGTSAFPEGDHLIVPRWSQGTTEDGSSGGPLFNPRGLVVGQLHGGRAACGNNDYDAFGRFSSAWSDGSIASERLMDWLDPLEEGLEELEGRWANLCAISLTTTTTIQTICVPDSAQFHLQVSEAFTAPVELSLLDLPDGWKARFSRTRVQPGDTLELFLSTEINQPLGGSTFQVEANDGTNQVVLELEVETKTLPKDFNIVEPQLNEEIRGSSTVLTWLKSSPDATYTLYVADNANFQDAQIIPTLSDTVFLLEQLVFETTYFWQVEATNSCGTKTATSTGTFRTPPDISILMDLASESVCPFDTLAVQITLGQGFQSFASLSMSSNELDLSEIFIQSSSNLELLEGGQVVHLQLIRKNAWPLGDYQLSITIADSGRTNQASLAFSVIHAPEASRLLEPQDGAVILDSEVHLLWELGQNAHPESLLQVARDSSFQELSINQYLNNTTFHLDLGDGVYYWRIWSENDCANTVSKTHSFQINAKNIGQLNGKKLAIIPNPTNGIVYIQFSEPLIRGQIEVLNMAGQLLQNIQIPDNNLTFNLTLEDYPSGIYLLRIKERRTSVTRRVILLR